jgi:hypothetical protein
MGCSAYRACVQEMYVPNRRQVTCVQEMYVPNRRRVTCVQEIYVPNRRRVTLSFSLLGRVLQCVMTDSFQMFKCSLFLDIFTVEKAYMRN